MATTNRVKRTDPDVILFGVRNTAATALTNGDVCLWMGSDVSPPTGFTRIPGVDVIQSNAANSVRVAGVITGPDIQQGDFGTMMVAGYHASVKTTAAALAVGSLVNSDASGAAVAGTTEGAILGTSITLGASNRAGIQLRCL